MLFAAADPTQMSKSGWQTAGVEERAILVWMAGAEVAASIVLAASVVFRAVAGLGLEATQATVMPAVAVVDWRRQEDGTAGAHAKHGAMRGNPGYLGMVTSRRDNQPRVRRSAEKVLRARDTSAGLLLRTLLPSSAGRTYLQFLIRTAKLL
jgi:hypothetical protein